MSSAVSMIGPKFYAWDSNGDPLAFGKVYTYEAGTSTPKATYTDETAATQNANPVILNADGYASIYLQGSYKVVVTDADDVQVWTADPVSDAGSLTKEWTHGRAATYVAPDEFKITGNLTSLYEAGRAVKMEDSSTLYGWITGSSYSGGETYVTVDTVGALTLSLSRAWTSITTPGSIPNNGYRLGASIVIKSVKTLADMKALDASELVDGQKVHINEHTAGTGLGGGEFYWDADNTQADNNGTIIQITGVATGRWLRRYSGPFEVTWFGAIGDGVYTGNADRFQESFDAIEALGGGSLHVPAGTYLFTKTIAFGGNFTLYGDGWNTILRANQNITDDSAGGHGFVSNKVIVAGHDNIIVRDIWIDQNNKTVPQDEALSLTSVRGFLYENVKVTNSNGYGIYATGNSNGPSENGEIVNCYAENNLYNIEVKGVYNYSITGNKIVNGPLTAGGGAIHIRESPGISERVVVANNIVTGGPGKGIDFINAAKDLVVANNIVSVDSSYAISFSGSATIPSERITVTGGIYVTKNKGVVPVSVSSFVSNVTFSGVVIKGGNQSLAIQGGNSENIYITGCRIENNPDSTSVMTACIYDVDDKGRMFVTGCRFIVNTEAAISEKYAVYCTRSQNNHVVNNIIEKPADISLPGGQNDNRVSNNIFLDGFYNIGVKWPETRKGQDRYIRTIPGSGNYVIDTGIQVGYGTTSVRLGYHRSGSSRYDVITGAITVSSSTGPQLVITGTLDDGAGFANTGSGFSTSNISVAKVGNAGTLQITVDTTSAGILLVDTTH